MFAADREELPRFVELEAEYELLGELGRGGTAVVYLARERELDRKVAIKVIRATYVEDEEAAARLTREAHTIAGLQHPNVVMLYGTRRLRDRSLALIMQYVEGRTLKTEVQENGPLSFVRTEQILRDIGSALAYAHRHRIVHRDIKPENIYLDAETGLARLSDFGIARPWDADSGLTLPGSAIGTPAYMSPEQIDGAVLDGRSDVFSLGLVGYEMLTGARPWAGETLFSIVVKQQRERLPPLAVARPGIPQRLLHAIEGAIRKRADERWQSVDDFLRALAGRAAPLRPEQETPVVAVTDTTPPASPTRESAAPQAPTGRTPATSHTITFDRRASGADDSSPGTTDAAPRRRRGKKNRKRRAAARQHATHELPAAQPVENVAVIAEPRTRRWSVLVAAATAVVIAGTGVTLAFSGVPDEPPPAQPVTSGEAAPAEAVSPAETVEPTATAPGEAAAVRALSGEGQAGIAGDTLPLPLVVRVDDAAGRPVPGATVRFAVVTGTGVIAPATAATDETGTASARWLPATAGTHEVEARVAELAEPVRFHARTLPRSPARLSAESETELRATAGTATQLAVRVADDRGEPVAGAEVRFVVRTGGGKLAGATAVTGSDGVARTEWTLGTASAQEAIATLPETPRARVVFTATATPAPLPVQRTVALGGTHSCQLASDGTASCWGGNDSGQLGDGSATRRAAAVRATAPEPLATIAAGVGHSCGIGVSSAAYCWGANQAGQLGDGTRSTRSQPTRVRVAERLAKVAVGMSHSCALDAAGRLYCWGQNAHGQLGDGTRADRTVPVRAAGSLTFRSVVLGWAHTCAIATDGAAYCWGRNGAGELGDGGTTDRADPARVSGGHRFTTIAVGSRHACGLVAAGAVVCWGQNSNGQLGNGTTSNSSLPVAVTGPEPFTALAAGGVHTCALTRDGAAHCWGRNTYGQLGDGTTEDRVRATPVEGGLRFSSIFASGAHTCANAAAGGLHCWGFNLEGQVGDGTRTNRLRPVPAGR